MIVREAMKYKKKLGHEQPSRRESRATKNWSKSAYGKSEQ